MGFANHNLVNKTSSLCQAPVAIRGHRERVDLGFARAPQSANGRFVAKIVHFITAAAFDNVAALITKNCITGREVGGAEPGTCQQWVQMVD